jgi:hypothetical protein
MTLVPLAAPSARLPPDGSADIIYVESHFQPMADMAKPLVERGLLPQATYLLPDDTPMVPHDHAQLLQDVGGAPEAIAEHFRSRFESAGGDPRATEEEYTAWLSGEYGACLHSTTPEAIVVKDRLMGAIDALLLGTAPEDPSWRGALRASVDALDALERPFAQYDRERFGGPTSRDRLITATRERYPDVFS